LCSDPDFLETVFAIFQDLRNPDANSTYPLGNHDPILTQPPADLIGQCRTRLDHRLTDPVQALPVLLLNGLGRDKAPVRTSYGLTDPFRLVIVVLVPLDSRLNKLGTDQPDLMPQLD
jgi:hypothetical protein